MILHRRSAIPDSLPFSDLRSEIHILISAHTPSFSLFTYPKLHSDLNQNEHISHSFKQLHAGNLNQL